MSPERRRAVTERLVWDPEQTNPGVRARGLAVRAARERQQANQDLCAAFLILLGAAIALMAVAL